MQEVLIQVSVQLRSDGKVNKGAIQEAVAAAVLAARPTELFSGFGATYAGYTVSLPPKTKKQV